MYQEIKLEKGFDEYDTLDDSNIKNLSKVNIFIGANNSGKSKLLRRLYYENNYQYIHKVINLREYSIFQDSLLNKIKSYCAKNNIKLQTDVLNRVKHTLNEAIFWTRQAGNINSITKLLEQLTPTHFTPLKAIDTPYYYHVQQIINDHLKSVFYILNKELGESININKIYIPTLRGLRHISVSSSVTGQRYQDVYFARTRDDYFPQKKTNDEDNMYTGLTFYDDISKLSHSGIDLRSSKNLFEDFLSKSFFNNKKVEITAEHSGKTLILIENEERAIEQLGDGIQSIIILTYPLFVRQGEDAIFFIEEPETHLHPGYQRLFIETLNRPEFSSFQYFITTHSNHLLDLTIENNNTSIYTFKKEKTDGDASKFLIENVATGDDNILQLIGANKSSVFLSNCTIWVEGITDRIYLRKYIDLYIDHRKDKDGSKIFKEDTHYSFVEYGGNNITHWSFLDSEDEHNNININKLCGKAFLITDSDGASNKDDGKPSKKKLRQEKLQDRLNDRYYCLKSREIENLLTKEVIQQTLLSLEPNSTLDFKNFLDKKTDIIHEPIGRLIQEKVNGLKRNYAADSGTIKNKIEFAKRAVEHLKSYDDLSDEAKILSEKIYAFIYKENT